jgi:hypothetical protein
LRAIFAIFRAGTGLDRQQRTDLNLARIEVLAVYLLRLEQQLKERFFKQSSNLRHCPACVVSHWASPKGVVNF